MKINSIRAFLISALVIIILYALGLFLPIMMTSKKVSKLYNDHEMKIIFENSRSSGDATTAFSMPTCSHGLVPLYPA